MNGIITAQSKTNGKLRPIIFSISDLLLSLTFSGALHFTLNLNLFLSPSKIRVVLVYISLSSQEDNNENRGSWLFNSSPSSIFSHIPYSKTPALHKVLTSYTQFFFYFVCIYQITNKFFVLLIFFSV